ncbi:MAG TPA: hypothetical protein VK211_17220 [Kamptonema sp.]|nr:hypothetical protein [Kamptonema sp.]
MNNNIKLILDAAMIVWAITLYLNAGQPVPQTEDAFQTWQLSLNRFLQSLPMTTGRTGLISTTVWYHE